MKFLKYIFSFLLVASVFSLVSAQAFRPDPPKIEYGYSVFYADYLDGQTTANGEYYRKDEMTCAHKTHPFGTLLKVTRLDNRQSVVVRVNDRGPYSDGCVVDISRIAAQQIDLIKAGKTQVAIEVVGRSGLNPQSPAPKRQDQMYARSAPPPTSYEARAIPQGYSEKSKKEKTYTAVKGGSAESTTETLKIHPSQKGYAIQIASYRDFTNAERQIRSMKEKGIKYLYIKEASNLDGFTLYKIVVAPFSDKFKAQQYLREFKRRYELDGLVIGL